MDKETLKEALSALAFAMPFVFVAVMALDNIYGLKSHINSPSLVD